jgi:hypothetical protein
LNFQFGFEAAGTTQPQSAHSRKGLHQLQPFLLDLDINLIHAPKVEENFYVV